MAVFLINICKFNGCGITFPSLSDLISHIEDTHIDYDPKVVEQKELAQPACLPLSYVLRFISDDARKETPYLATNAAGVEMKRKLAIKHHSYSLSSSNRSNTPTGSEMDEDEMVVTESEDSNDSWTTEEFSSEFIMRYGSRHSGGGANGTPGNEKPFACPVPGCKKRYKNVNGIKYHSKNGHKKDGKVRKGFKCHCGKSYKTAQGLKNHALLTHNAQPESVLTTQQVAAANVATSAGGGNTLLQRSGSPSQSLGSLSPSSMSNMSSSASSCHGGGGGGAGGSNSSGGGSNSSNSNNNNIIAGSLANIAAVTTNVNNNNILHNSNNVVTAANGNGQLNGNMLQQLSNGIVTLSSNNGVQQQQQTTVAQQLNAVILQQQQQQHLQVTTATANTTEETTSSFPCAPTSSFNNNQQPEQQHNSNNNQQQQQQPTVVASSSSTPSSPPSFSIPLKALNKQVTTATNFNNLNSNIMMHQQQQQLSLNRKSQQTTMKSLATTTSTSVETPSTTFIDHKYHSASGSIRMKNNLVSSLSSTAFPVLPYVGGISNNEMMFNFSEDRKSFSSLSEIATASASSSTVAIMSDTGIGVGGSKNSSRDVSSNIGVGGADVNGAVSQFCALQTESFHQNLYKKTIN